MTEFYHCSYETPLGVMRAIGNESFVCALDFEEDLSVGESRPWVSRFSPRGDLFPLDFLREELSQYFSGALRLFQTPYFFRGTAFQELVWRGLSSVSYGETRSYGALAQSLSSSKASRAVGRAVGANPLILLVPCHRVVGAHGLGGYRGGIERKEWLLSHELGS